MSMRVLITRPEPDGTRTAEALRARGHAVLVSPVLHMEPVNAKIPEGRFAGVVFTSINAVRATAAHPEHTAILTLPVFAVGSRTAEAARGMGFSDVRSANGNSNDLLQLLNARIAAGAPCLYLAGEDRAADLGQSQNIVTVVVYRMRAVEYLSAAAEQALGAHQIDGVLHFSARSAQAYVDCCARSEILQRALAPVQFCLSAQVAAPLAAAGAPVIRTASRPHETELIALVCEEARTRLAAAAGGIDGPRTDI
jgi:uroporphyrinogen-III synthase